ncbi:DUF2199 domain-containing protein [Puniceibacterium sediminis]|uniref:DUF2199 domain-containing protein n=1 Tax=Puniceibacterium sediminis TaxID=1608407 RepID=A0A238XI23_9RHOB|nr:DUF2199 domain-containing protein [Puniceibacterium sediminis]SNR58350.1 hypothetical protein SAMN06265370_11194 [Puniceibacterium sediminis]
MSLLDLDARWRRFNDPLRACPCCGKHFSGVFDIGFEEPDDWPHGPRSEEMLKVGDDKLSSELCRLNNRRFLRCVILLPLRGSDTEVFFFGLWAEVSPTDFYAYLDGSTEDGAPVTSIPATVANDLPHFGDAAHGTLVPGTGLERPRLIIAEGPLAEGQKNGISFDELLDIYAASGKDIRPHLTRD